jgi:hypothetical protein
MSRSTAALRVRRAESMKRSVQSGNPSASSAQQPITMAISASVGHQQQEDEVSSRDEGTMDRRRRPVLVRRNRGEDAGVQRIREGYDLERHRVLTGKPSRSGQLGVPHRLAVVEPDAAHLAVLRHRPVQACRGVHTAREQH